MNAWVKILIIIAACAPTLVDDIFDYNVQHGNLYDGCDPNSPIIRCDLLPDKGVSGSKSIKIKVSRMIFLNIKVVQ